MKVIIPCSTGLDSVYVLWKILSTTQDDVTAIFLTEGELHSTNKIKYDLRAFDAFNRIGIHDRVTSIMSWLKTNVRDFKYFETPMELDYLSKAWNEPNNAQTYMVRYATPKINTGEYDKLIICTERENDGFANGGTIQTRRTGGMAALDLFKTIATRGEISFPLMETTYNQAHALVEMPQELIDLTFSCQSGLPDPCGQCFKCTKRKFFCDEIAAGKTLSEIDALVESKSVLPNGKWMSMKYWVASEENAPEWEMLEWPSSYAVP
jgi:7-cyano-7-deazaguanine synthase in queuosine biosynthesis